MILQNQKRDADALSIFINRNLERLEKEDEEEMKSSHDILLEYDAKMKKFF